MLVRAVLFAGCDHEALMLGRWPSKRPHFTTERVECCDHGLYIACAVAGLIFCFFCHVMATAKIQPQEMNLCDLGFGKLVSGIFKEFTSHYLAATKNIQPQEVRIWPQLVLGSFQGLASPYLAAAGHQKIQPQETIIFSLFGPSSRGTVSKNLARIPLSCRLRKLRGATEQLLKDN